MHILCSFSTFIVLKKGATGLFSSGGVWMNPCTWYDLNTWTRPLSTSADYTQSEFLMRPAVDRVGHSHSQRVARLRKSTELAFLTGEPPDRSDHVARRPALISALILKLPLIMYDALQRSGWRVQVKRSPVMLAAPSFYPELSLSSLPCHLWICWISRTLHVIEWLPYPGAEVTADRKNKKGMLKSKSILYMMI